MTLSSSQKNTRNFCVIAHIDHGKSTLADRFLELTGTVQKRAMKEQILDSMDIERERGITIKLAPARMLYRRDFDRGLTRTETRTDADTLLYEDLTYKIRGAVFAVRKELGLGHKESIYHKAFAKELEVIGVQFESEKSIGTFYKGERVGSYVPDFIIDDKILVELKALPEIGKPQQEQVWSYLKGSSYKLALLVNFGSKDIDIRRIVYDTARPGQRESAFSPRESAQVEEYTLNLIDTPGHADFGYEVSRSLAAVDGAILLVDASQGVQAQTLATVHSAIEQDLTIIPVMNKIDLPQADVEKTRAEIIALIGGNPNDILAVSGKTGQGVLELLDAVIDRVPPPTGDEAAPLRALIFDAQYNSYKGIVAYVRVVDGSVKKGDRIHLFATGKESEVLEVGTFAPKMTACDELRTGSIGYIVTGFKDLLSCRVGDTVLRSEISNPQPLSGYKEVKPMVFAGFFPKDASQTEDLREAVEKLKMNDAAFSFEPEQSDALGVGFRCGFLGLLHMDIIRERLEREYDLKVVATVPSVGYLINKTNGEQAFIRSAVAMPDPSVIASVEEPWVSVDAITQGKYVGNVMQLIQEFRGIYKNTEYLGQGDAGRVILHYEMPLSQILVDFYDKLKSAAQGYASLNYVMIGYRQANVRRMDILIAEKIEESLATIVYEDEAHEVGKRIVNVLKDTIPSRNFVVKLQAAIGGKIVASERIGQIRKDVTAGMYGGDVTRKRKLLEKQKKGKKKMAGIAAGGVEIPPEAYLKVLKR